MYASNTNHEEVFSLLSNQRRRYTVRACHQLETPIELGELAEYIAAEESDKSISEITGEERRRVYTSLQQVHIDKLEEASVIKCEQKTITPTERLEELEFYLEVVPGDEILWAQYYLGLSGVGAVFVILAWLGVYPDALTGYNLTMGVVTVFAVSAGVHYWQTKQNRLGMEATGDE